MRSLTASYQLSDSDQANLLRWGAMEDLLRLHVRTTPLVLPNDTAVLDLKTLPGDLECLTIELHEPDVTNLSSPLFALRILEPVLYAQRMRVSVRVIRPEGHGWNHPLPFRFFLFLDRPRASDGLTVARPCFSVKGWDGVVLPLSASSPYAVDNAPDALPCSAWKRIPAVSTTRTLHAPNGGAIRYETRTVLRYETELVAERMFSFAGTGGVVVPSTERFGWCVCPAPLAASTDADMGPFRCMTATTTTEYPEDASYTAGVLVRVKSKPEFTFQSVIETAARLGAVALTMHISDGTLRFWVYERSPELTIRLTSNTPNHLTFCRTAVRQTFV